MNQATNDIAAWRDFDRHLSRCSIPDCPQRATAMLFYLDDQERFYCQTGACDGRMNQLCAGLRVIERGQHPDA
jgi:hypothetical protein